MKCNKHLLREDVSAGTLATNSVWKGKNQRKRERESVVAEKRASGKAESRREKQAEKDTPPTPKSTSLKFALVKVMQKGHKTY